MCEVSISEYVLVRERERERTMFYLKNQSESAKIKSADRQHACTHKYTEQTHEQTHKQSERRPSGR